MVDMLARLFHLPEIQPIQNELQKNNILIRRPHPAESETICAWVADYFSARWAKECQGAIEHRPPTCFIAVKIQKSQPPASDPYDLPAEKLLGFACYDIVARGMFGPTGVHPDWQGQKIGKTLLLASLHAMAADGYGYAVIPWVGPIEFYEKTVGATIIENSEPGVFRGPLIK